MFAVTSQFASSKGQGIVDPVVAIVRTSADLQRLKGQRDAGAATEVGTAAYGRGSGEFDCRQACRGCGSGDAVGGCNGPHGAAYGHRGGELRVSTARRHRRHVRNDSMRQESLHQEQTMVASMRCSVKLYEETGEVYSKHGEWRPTEADLSFHGGAEALVQSWRDQIKVSTNIGIPQEQAVIDELRANRLQSLRDYGLAPPSVDQVA